MPHHGNEFEHEAEEPVRFTDKRKIDPETGAVRGDSAADSPQSGANANNGAPHEEVVEAGEAHDTDDALKQAEDILNNASAAAGSTGADESASTREAELRTDLLRLQAEYVNYRKRVERDREVVRHDATRAALAQLLPVLDDLDAARAAGDLEEGPFASIANKFEQILTNTGFERINEVGVPFDPTVHEALMQQPNAEIPADHVAMVLRSGYSYKDRVVRAAQVVVSTGPAE